MGDITADFSYSDFRPYDTAITWLPGNNMLQEKIDILAEGLQVIQDNVPSGVTLNIISGVRTIADYKRLVRAGGNPSRMSEHYFGDPVPLSPGTPEYSQYGRMFYYTVGAADIVSSDNSLLDAKGLFDLAKDLVKSSACNLSQVVYEYDPKLNIDWVHFTNNQRHFFSEHVMEHIEKRQFLQSLDNGKTYQIIK